ncbi:hypothetical protein BTVI_82596 [Pitangus sulphuratus]|nr:hypothetical protein BTVI_82596 [Pitangus sulphuratus]
MIRQTEKLSCEERLRELRLLILEKRRLQDGLIVAFQYLKGAYKQYLLFQIFESLYVYLVLEDIVTWNPAVIQRCLNMVCLPTIPVFPALEGESTLWGSEDLDGLDCAAETPPTVKEVEDIIPITLYEEKEFSFIQASLDPKNLRIVQILDISVSQNSSLA